MVIYILKFSACLAVFMLFYKLVLERENIHHFKRFYLLTALLVSAAIPFITFTTFVYALPDANPIVFSNLETNPVSTKIAPSFSDYLPSILWAIYYLGLLVFSGRFTFNLYQLVKRIKQNPKFKKGRFVHVLLSDLIYPHTFLQYIFLNKSKYEAHKIPHEVLLHEETHAKQKHALDILFIELMQIIFWFNPLLYFIKKDIKLNHEFLADQAVLETGTDTKTYQHILLAFSASKTMEDAQTHHLANAINYSLIKKRFTVMKSHTSNTVKWVKGLIILPVLAVLIYSFSSTKEVFKPVEPDVILSKTPEGLLLDDSKQVSAYTIVHSESPENNLIESRQNGASKEQIAEYNKLAKHYNSQKGSNYTIKLSDIKRIKYLYNLMTEEQKTNAEPLPTFPPPPPPPTQSMTKSEEQDYKNQINKSKKGESYTYQYQNNDGKIVKVIVDENDLSIPPPPPPVPADASPEQKAKYKKISNEYYKKYKVENGKISERLQPPPPPPAPPAPPKTMAVGKKIDQEYYDSLGRLNQDENAKTGFVTINNKKHFYTINQDDTKYYNRLGYEVDINGKTLSTTQTNGTDVIPGQKISKVYQNNQVVSEFNKNWESESVVLNSPPPPPISPLEHINKMTKKGVSFFYEGKSVSPDKAIAVLKNNHELNILTKNVDSNNPLVFITKAPINQDIISKVEIPKPTPANASSHLKVMNRHNAKFYIDGKEVSFNEALKAIRKNKNADINSTLNPPIVKITTE